MDRNAIQAEHDRLEYKTGWSFMYTPEARLYDADVALVGLNPGGCSDNVGRWDCPQGNAYIQQNWSQDGTSKSPLQVQIAALLNALGLRHDQILAAQFIPFRSASWDKLEKKGEAIAFGQALWNWVLKNTSATRFICLGTVAASELTRLTGAQPDGRCSAFQTGWGNQTFGRYVSSRHVVVRVPHLSRYKLFNRGGEHDNRVHDAIKAASASL